MESEQLEPKIQRYTEVVVTDEEEYRVHLVVITYSNAVQAALYDEEPKLGSMVLGYRMLEQVEQQVIFGGKHDQLASALAMLLARHVNKITYASVNLTDGSPAKLENIKALVEQYVSSL